jgi:hypothetical protein
MRVCAGVVAAALMILATVVACGSVGGGTGNMDGQACTLDESHINECAL